jgi:hypothetical protein
VATDTTKVARKDFRIADSAELEIWAWKRSQFAEQNFRFMSSDPITLIIAKKLEIASLQKSKLFRAN